LFNQTVGLDILGQYVELFSKSIGSFFKNRWIISRNNPTVGLNSLFKYLTQLLAYFTQLEFNSMHCVKITHSWEGAIPPHSWVIFNPTILSEFIQTTHLTSSSTAWE